MKRYIRSAVDNYLDKDMGYRAMMAMHTPSPREIALLARDPEELVRAYIAGNPNTPSDLLSALATDPKLRVRMHAARNRNTPLPALHKLCSDKYDIVRKYAVETLAALGGYDE